MDFEQALATGEIPGAFQHDRTVWAFPEAASCGGRPGRRRVWKIRVAAFSARGVPIPIEADYLRRGGEPPKGAYCEISSEYYLEKEGGAGKVAASKKTRVDVGKNLGKANATNPVTQALSEAFSRYRRHLKSNGAPADSASATAPPQPLPMLVQKLGKTVAASLTKDDFVRGVSVQRKYNGVRAVAFLDPGRGAVIYSRRGVEYEGLDGVRAALAGLLKSGEPGAPIYLDGELYRHGRPLEWISGEARRGGAGLEYVVFDCFFPDELAAGRDRPSGARQDRLRALFRQQKSGPVRLAETRPAAEMAEVERLYAAFLQEGYEGAIVRKDRGGYQYGVRNYHSPNLLKMKPLLDSEFPVVGFEEGGKGKDKGALIWVCEVPLAETVDPADRRFSVVPKNKTYAQRYEMFRSFSESPGAFEAFRGRMLTVEYPERSQKTGKPIQAKAIGFRGSEDL